MGLRTCVAKCLVLFFSIVQPSAWAVTETTPIPEFYKEAGASVNRMYVDQDAHERIDPFTGKLQLHYVDLFLPGNGGLDIKLQRSYTSLDNGTLGGDFWTGLSVGQGWTMHFGRVLRSAPYPLCDATQSNANFDPVLELPDGGRRVLYPQADRMTFRTTDQWKAECNGFYLNVYSPDGLKYEMTHQANLTPEVNVYWVSRITDKNGNWLSFTYSGTNLTSITSSDGRLVTLTYTGNVLSTVSDGTRTWTYEVLDTPGALGNANQLRSVTRPDGAAWVYEYHSSGPGAYSISAVVHPNKGRVSYSYGEVNFDSVRLYPSMKRSVVVGKTIDSADCNTGQCSWTFSYFPATTPITPSTTYSFGQGIDNPQFDRTVIEGPDGTQRYSHFGYGSILPGMVFLVGSVVAREVYGQQNESFGYAKLPVSWQTQCYIDLHLCDLETFSPALLVKKSNRNGLATTTSFGNYSSVGADGTYIDSAITSVGPNGESFGFDEYGNPSKVSEANDSFGRVTSYTYYIDTAKWIVHAIASETFSGTHDGTEAAGSGRSIVKAFNANGNVSSENRFGVITTYTYTPEGDLATKTNANNFTSTYSNYKRGIPQLEIHPESVTITRVVSDQGNVLSETDGETATTSYTYDGLNRVTRIERPLGNPTIVEWKRKGVAGAAANTRTVTRGNNREVTTYDGFGRPVQIDNIDLATSETITRISEYDGAGRKVFDSYPNSTKGTKYLVDALGRVNTYINEYDKTTGIWTSSRALYFAFNTIETTNERGLTYISRFLVYGNPDEAQLIALETPEDVAAGPTMDFTMKRDLFGNLLEVSQGTIVGSTQKQATRTYGYNEKGFLIEERSPESGVTTFGRDPVGNMTTRQVNANPATSFTYDGLNRVTAVTYPIGTPSVTRGYYKDGNLKFVDNGIARLEYQYDANKNLWRQTLAVDSQQFALGYTYDANDALATMTYPSGLQVSFNPDAFGRARQMAPFVGQITYHPSGVPQTIAYANGVTTSTGVNARQWPNTLQISRSGLPFVNSTYSYDDLGNVWRIADPVDSRFNRTMAYDAVDRVKQVAGPWGTTTFTYDGVSNIVQQDTPGGSKLDYTYDSATNRLTSMAGTYPLGSTNDAYTYDSYGNVSAKGSLSLAFDDAGNMRCARCGGENHVSYDYSGGNLRVVSQSGSQKTYFFYDQGGRLIYERQPGAQAKEYFYVAGKQVATRRLPEAVQ